MRLSIFLDEILNGEWPRRDGDVPAKITVRLHGSLAFTGKGHATDTAIILGLSGQKSSSVDSDRVKPIVEQVTANKTVSPPGHPTYDFDPETDLIFDYDVLLPVHTNGMTFEAWAAGRTIAPEKRILFGWRRVCRR